MVNFCFAPLVPSLSSAPSLPLSLALSRLSLHPKSLRTFNSHLCHRCTAMKHTLTSLQTDLRKMYACVAHTTPRPYLVPTMLSKSNETRVNGQCCETQTNWTRNLKFTWIASLCTVYVWSQIGSQCGAEAKWKINKIRRATAHRLQCVVCSREVVGGGGGYCSQTKCYFARSSETTDRKRNGEKKWALNLW